MSPWDVEVIKDDGRETHLIPDLKRVFYEDFRFRVECGDGSIGRLENAMMGKVIEQREEIVEEECRKQYENLQSLFRCLRKPFEADSG